MSSSIAGVFPPVVGSLDYMSTFLVSLPFLQITMKLNPPCWSLHRIKRLEGCATSGSNRIKECSWYSIGFLPVIGAQGLNGLDYCYGFSFRGGVALVHREQHVAPRRHELLDMFRMAPVTNWMSFWGSHTRFLFLLKECIPNLGFPHFRVDGIR